MAGESRSVVVRLSLDTAQAIRASKEFGTEFDRAMTQAERRTSSTRASMDELTSTSGKLALAAGVGLAAVVATTANFDEAMSHVAATGDDARSSIEQLRDAAISAGQETAFSATEAAGGIENLAKAGVSAQDILGGGLAGALDLAAAGGLDVASAAEIAATALTQFKLSGEDVPHVADLLAAGAGKAQGDVTDLSMALKQSGLVASQMNLSIEETTGTLAAFASAGLLGSDAGTSFRTMLLRLSNATPEARELMDQLGISVYDTQGQFVGMSALAGQLQTSLSGLSQEQRDAALATLFGSDAIRAASVLYEQGSAGIDDWTRKVDDSGYAAETAATRMDNLKGDVEQFTGALETALIGSGSGSQGVLRDLVQGATDVVNVFNRAPAPIQGTATALLAVTAIGAGGFWFTSKAVTTINDTRNALDDLGWSSDRVGRSLKVVAGLGTAATVLIAVEQAAAELVRSTDKAAPAIEGLTNDLIALDTLSGVQGIAEGLGDLRGSIEVLADPGLAQNIGDVYDKVPLVGSAFADIAPGLAGARQEARDAQTSITALDDALANIVAKGSPEQAADVFDQLATAYGLTADEQETLRGLLPGYQEALDGVANTTELTAGASEDLATKQRAAAAQAKALRAALAEQRGAARDTARSFVNLGDSLDDGKKSLSDWLRELENQTQALRDFMSNARAAAKRGLDEGLIKSLNEAGPAGALRMKQLANATDAEIKRANKAWREGQAAIRDYVNMQVPTKKPKVDNSQALSAVYELRTALQQLRDRTVYVNMVYKRSAFDVATGSANGGSVPKTGLPYADRHPYLLADGEEVISNRYGQADRHRSLLKAINANHLANGGTTGPYARAGAGGTPNTDPTSAATSAAAAMNALAEASGKELKARQRLLEQEVAAAKERLQNLRSERQALASTVADRFRGDIFGQGGNLPSFGDLPDDMAREDREWLIGQRNAQVAAAAKANSPVSILKQQIQDAREMRQLMRRLRDLGLGGAALAEVATSASLEEMRALVASPRLVHQFEDLYGDRRRITRGLGQQVGGAVFDRRIDQQTAELKGLRQEMRNANHRLNKLEEIRQATEKGADRVVGAVKGVSDSARRHR